MKVSEVAQAITESLQLDVPLVALSFVQTRPEGVMTWEDEVPSACSFWRKAETHVFFATAGKHFNCPIGAMTMGFALPAHVRQQLGEVVGKMTACAYVTSEEVAHIPTVMTESEGIVYGPLSSFPLQPDLILMWLTPRQAMLMSEAVGSVRWGATQPASVFGRPACAALPVALHGSNVALSLGCTGMRTFTGVREDRLLAVLPGARAIAFVEALEATIEANRVMGAFYGERQTLFAS